MTMMQWKKPIRNNGGFTLVEMLVAFSCVAVSCVLLMPVVSALQRLQEPVYYSEDRIAMYQLRFLLAQSRAVFTGEHPFLHLSKKEADTGI